MFSALYILELVFELYLKKTPDSVSNVQKAPFVKKEHRQDSHTCPKGNLAAAFLLQKGGPSGRAIWKP